MNFNSATQKGLKDYEHDDFIMPEREKTIETFSDQKPPKSKPSLRIETSQIKSSR